MNDSTRVGNQALVHVGYHKAGSTWLQRILFADPSLAFTLPFDRAEVNERLVAPKQLVFDEARERAYFAAGLAGCGDRTPVLSNERFSGNPHSGGWDSRILAERLARLFPDARILIVIREQRSAIRSVYLQYVREGGGDPLARYLAPPEAGKLRRPLFDLDFFAYHRLVECYQELFGRERVLVLPYELLSENALEFATKICAFAEVAPPEALPDRRPNIALSPFSAVLKRRLNRWFVADTLNPSPPFPVKRANAWFRTGFEFLDRHLPSQLEHTGNASIERQIAALTANRYTSSNERTSHLTALDLSAFGYDLR